MAQITYKLYNPETKAYDILPGGKEERTTDESLETLQKYAAKKNLKLEIVSGPTGAAAGSTIVPRETAVASTTPIGAIGGGLLSGMSLGFRDEIFGKDEETGEYPQDIEKEAWPKLYEGARVVGSIGPDVALSLLGAGLTRGRVSPARLAAVSGALTGGIEAVGEAPEGEKLSSETLGSAAAGAIGGATGGYLGEKVIGPLIKKAGKALVKKIKSNVPKFGGDIVEETRESSMDALNKEAQQLMIEKEAAEAALQKQKKLRAETRSELEALEPAKKKAGLDDLPEEGQEYFQEAISDISPKQMKTILQKQIDDLTDVELFARIDNVLTKNYRNINKIKELEDLIANSNLGIQQKRAAYEQMKKKLIQHDGLVDYLKRFKSSALGGATGAAVGKEIGQEAVRPAGIKKGTI